MTENEVSFVVRIQGAAFFEPKTYTTYGKACAAAVTRAAEYGGTVVVEHVAHTPEGAEYISASAGDVTWRKASAAQQRVGVVIVTDKINATRTRYNAE